MPTRLLHITNQVDNIERLTKSNNAIPSRLINYPIRLKDFLLPFGCRFRIA